MNNEIKDNLIVLLKIFANKPQYLIKFLLDNNAFTEDFLTKVFNSIELNRIRTFNENEEESNNDDIFLELPHFKNINDMNRYFKDIIGDDSIDLSNEQESIYDRINKTLEIKLRDDLKNALIEERFEDAAIYRDRMIELNIEFN